MTTASPIEAALSRLDVSAPPTHGSKEPWLQKPASTIVGGNMLHDISNHFRTAAAELAVGELVKDEEFTLFESVGALEIMDPKMDSGYLAPGETLDDDYDVMRFLLPEEIIGIMDQMLCCEIAWHEGYPLSQTVFSSHYIDQILRYCDEAKQIDDVRFSKKQLSGDVDFVVNRILKPYCIALIKCCDLALETITQSGHFYEEEDFSTHTYGRNLLQKIHESEVVKLLLAAIDEVSRHKSLPCKEAILDRLLLRLSLISAMACQFNQGAFQGKATFHHWEDATGLAGKISSTHELGKPVAESFSPKIQRRLASTQPPRALVELKFEDAIPILGNICKDCRETERIIMGHPQSAEQLKVLLMAFSSRTPEPLPYARACLTRSVLSEGDEGFGEILKVDLRETVLPADPVLDPYNWAFEAPRKPDRGLRNLRYESANSLTSFTNMFTASVGGYTDIFRALLSNRCRLRRNLCHVIRTFDTVEQVEAREVDVVLNGLTRSPESMSAWVHLQKLRLMVLTVQLGFELAVYLPDELCAMYWYLGCLESLLHSECASLLSRLTTSDAGRSKVSFSEQAEVEQAYTFIEGLHILSQGSVQLAEALKLIYQLLSYQGLIAQPKQPLNEGNWGARRWEMRMKPFLHIQNPAFPAYNEVWQATHPSGPYPQSPQTGSAHSHTAIEDLETIETLACKAKACFERYKKAGPSAAFATCGEADWEDDIANCIDSCVALTTAAQSIKNAVHTNCIDQLKVDVKMPGQCHRWWIVPIVSDG